MNVKIVVLAAVIFLIILFLFNLLADSSMFFRIVASAIITASVMYYLHCDGNPECKRDNGYGGRDFTAEDGMT